MTAARQIPLVSVEEYLAQELVSEERHEYLGGYVHAMAGGRTIHNRVKGDIYAALHKRLAGRPCEPFDSDMKVRVRTFGSTRFYYPDVMVVCSPNEPESMYQDRPVVVVEVLSEGTRRLDEGEKRDGYLSIPSLGVYMLVEPDKVSVAVYRRDQDGPGSEAFRTELYCDLVEVIELPEIGASLPLAEVYERVGLSGRADA